LSFNQLYINEKAESKVTLTNNTDKVIKITDIQVTPPEMKINLRKNDLLPVKEAFALIGTYTPTASGRLNCSVVITTDNSDMQNITITGYGNIISKEAAPADSKSNASTPNQLPNGEHK
jgi:hypothetical protein